MKKLTKIIKRIEKRATFINLLFTAVMTISVVFSAASWWISKEALVETKKQAQASFILDLNRDFLMNDRLYRMRKDIESKIPSLVVNGGAFTVQDIDDYIGTFETMSDFMDRGVLDKDIIDNNFGAFIVDAYKNKEIYNYIIQLRKDLKSEDYYAGFEKFANEFSSE